MLCQILLYKKVLRVLARQARSVRAENIFGLLSGSAAYK